MPKATLALVIAIASGCATGQADDPADGGSPSALDLPRTSRKPSPPPHAKLVRHANKVPGEYIVVFKDAARASRAVNAPRLAATVDRLATAHNARVGARYVAGLRGFAGAMSEADALDLSQDPEVDFVEEKNPNGNYCTATQCPPDDTTPNILLNVTDTNVAGSDGKADPGGKADSEGEASYSGCSAGGNSGLWLAALVVANAYRRRALARMR